MTLLTILSRPEQVTRLVCAVFGTLCAGCGAPPEVVSTGETRSAIVNGEAGADGAALATVALVRRPHRSPSCSGVLVAGDLVITAAHCVAEIQNEPSALLVVAGVLDARAASAAEEYAVDAVTVHPGFPGPPSTDPTSLGARFDIAVLGLARAVEGVAPLSVLAPDRAARLLVPEAELGIAGYGSTDRDGTSRTGVLRSGTVTIERTSESELLAGRPGTADTCNGDSGGPAVAKVDGRAWLAAITSRERQDGSAPCGDGTVFEIVSSEAEFLEDAGVVVGTAGADRDEVASCSASAAGAMPPAPGRFPWIAIGTLLWSVARRDQNRRRPT